MSTRKRMPVTIAALAVAIMAVSMLPKPARAITTPQIIASAASTQCLDYQVVGVCVWLTCTPFGCWVDTSVKVKHYMPDLVVSTYQRTGGNPWPAVAPLAPPNPLSMMGGVGTQDSTGHHTNLRFYNADAIGHPAAAGFDLLSAFGMTCESAATPMFPYYLSVFDPLAWRAGIPEKFYPASLIPGLRTIGSPFKANVWGHVYPRSGFVYQANPYKAAAVAAQRVADFVTRLGQPHVYVPLHTSAHPGYWPPDPVIEGDPSTHKWQRLQPNLSMSCAVFPDHSTFAFWGGDIAFDGDYVWALWRPYSCCKRVGETLIAVISF